MPGAIGAISPLKRISSWIEMLMCERVYVCVCSVIESTVWQISISGRQSLSLFSFIVADEVRLLKVCILNGLNVLSIQVVLLRLSFLFMRKK